MCTRRENIELARNEKGCVVLCKCCMKYSITYTNTSFCFSREEVEKFRAALLSFRDSDFCFNIMGESRAILQTQYTNMGFSVSWRDIRVLDELIQEALVLSEVYDVLNK